MADTFRIKKINFVTSSEPEEKIVISRRVQSSQKDPLEESKLVTQRPKNRFKKRSVRIGIALVAIVVLIYVTVITPLQKTYVKAQELMVAGREAASAAKAQNLPQTKEKLIVVNQKFEELKQQYYKTSFLKFIPLAGGYYKDGEHGINAGIELVKAGQRAVEAITPYADLLGFSEGNPSFVSQSADQRIETTVKTFDKVIPELSVIDEHLAKAKTEIDQINANRYPSKVGGRIVRSKIKDLQQKTSEGIAMFLNAKPLLEILPELLGEPESKRYLILFQNDKELRATGGFITAYALFKVDKGKFIVEKSEDIYNLDERQKKRIAARAEILKYHKGVFYAYLRDSNTSPDFYQSMKQFEELYENVSGAESYDGIVTVDTNVLVEVMRVLDGEVFIPEYNTKFTVQPDNRCDGCPQVVYELELFADKPVGYFRGERKDIIGRLMLSLMQKALGVSPGQYWGLLMQTFVEQINQKHILAYMHDDTAQKAFEALNFAGRINEYEGDYLHINDTNFAGAKSNLFVRHFVKQDIEIARDGTVVKTVTIDYKNPSEPSNCSLEGGGLCLNGLLRNWLRVYVPKGSKLITFTGADGEGIKPETSEDLGKTVYEGFLTVRPLGSAQVIVKYELPFKMKDSYNLMIQKQPGTAGHEYTTIINGKEVNKFQLTTDKEFQFKL